MLVDDSVNSHVVKVIPRNKMVTGCSGIAIKMLLQIIILLKI